MVARRKAPKQEAPQTIEQAVAMIAEYRDLLGKIDELAHDAATSIAAIEAARDQFAAPIEQRAKDLFKRLRVWWGVSAPELTDGKRKSILMAGCTIGERTTTPALSHEGQKAEAVVEALADLGMEELLRITAKLDKQACIRAIAANNELGELLLWLGANIRQVEEFFIDVPKQDPDPVTVEVEEAA